MKSWSQDVMDQPLLVHLSQYPETLLDFLGLSSPSPEDILIQSETLKELITMAKNKLNTAALNADIDEAAQLAAEAAGQDTAETTAEVDDGSCLTLHGGIMTIKIFDESLKLDEFGLPGLIQGMADKAQYTRVNGRYFINKVMAQAKERMDATAALSNRPKVESNGDIIDHDGMGELEGLTAAQLLMIERTENQIDVANLLMEDLDSWYSVLSASDRPLLRNSDAEVLKRILDREDKKQADLQALIEQRKFLSDVRSKRLESMSRGVQA